MTSIFLTGATGYIGGGILEHLLRNKEYKITALVRDSSKASKLKDIGVTPVIGDLDSHQVIFDNVLKTDVVIHAANCDHLPSAKSITEALIKKLNDTKKKGIYIQVSGSGIVSDKVRGASASQTITDDSDDVATRAIPVTNPHRNVDTFLFEKWANGANFALAIVAPTDIYGQTSGNGGISNPVSAQIPLVVKNVVKHKKAFGVGKGLNIWSNVHVDDLSDLFIIILEKLLKGELKPEDQGYYFAENGEHVWKDVYEEIGRLLVKKGLSSDPTVNYLNTEEEITSAFGFKEAEYYVGTNSRVKGTKCRKIGWAPKHNDVLKTIEGDFDYYLSLEKK